MASAASEAVAGARAGERDWWNEERRRAWMDRVLGEVRASERTLRMLERSEDFVVRLAEAEGSLAARGFTLAVLETAPDGFRLLLAERAASLAEALDLQGAGDPVDGCSGRCERCPQRSWCEFGKSPAW